MTIGRFALMTSIGRREANSSRDELAPAVLPVQLEHRLDVDIGLARAGLHLNIQAAPPQAFDKGCGEPDVVLALQGLNVVQKLLVGKFDGFVSIARVVQRVNTVRALVWDSERSLTRLRLDSATVANVADPVVKTLPLEDAHNGIDRIGLVLLYFEIKLHLTTPSLWCRGCRWRKSDRSWLPRCRWPESCRASRSSRASAWRWL